MALSHAIDAEKVAIRVFRDGVPKISKTSF